MFFTTQLCNSLVELLLKKHYFAKQRYYPLTLFAKNIHLNFFSFKSLLESMTFVYALV